MPLVSRRSHPSSCAPSHRRPLLGRRGHPFKKWWPRSLYTLGDPILTLFVLWFRERPLFLSLGHDCRLFSTCGPPRPLAIRGMRPDHLPGLLVDLFFRPAGLPTSSFLFLSYVVQLYETGPPARGPCSPQDAAVSQCLRVPRQGRLPRGAASPPVSFGQTLSDSVDCP